MQALSENPALEAVTIDRKRQTVSLAILGQADVPRLTERLHSTLERTQEAQNEHQCTMLTGQGDCGNCLNPLPLAQRERITILHQQDATTIARVTCPTARKFWRWRDIPFPKVVPRELEYPEDEHELNEWKVQLLAAGVCGL